LDEGAVKRLKYVLTPKIKFINGVERAKKKNEARNNRQTIISTF
jgi:hypothetical protein